MKLIPTSVAHHRATSGATRLAESVRARREANGARRQLRRDLATYTTPSEVNDLLFLLAGSEDPMAEEIRSILTEYPRRAA